MKYFHFVLIVSEKNLTNTNDGMSQYSCTCILSETNFLKDYNVF